MLVRLALELAAVGAVAYLFVRERALFLGLGAAISHLNWYWVVAAFAAELASVPPLAEAQRLVLRAGGVEPDRLRMNLSRWPATPSRCRCRRAWRWRRATRSPGTAASAPTRRWPLGACCATR